MPDHGILGLRFRQQDKDNAEALYFRPQKACNTSPDCMQYMPLDHGAFEWDLFPEDQVAAPIHLLSWTTFTGGRGAHDAGLHQQSNAAYAPRRQYRRPCLGRCLIIWRSSHVRQPCHHLKPSAPPHGVVPASNDTFLREWKVSTSSPLPTMPDPVLKVPMGTNPPYAARPMADQIWNPVTADVNFSRDVGSASDGSVVSIAWAKTTLLSSKMQTKQISIGWVRGI